MHDHGKSDRPVVPAKPPNKPARAGAEAVEGRGLGKGNAASKTRPGHRAGVSASSALDRVRRVARQDKDARFTALLHHVDVDRLRAAYGALNPKAATGVDKVTWYDYGQDLEANLGICTLGFTGARTGQGRRGGCTSRRRMGGSDRWVLPRWRT